MRNFLLKYLHFIIAGILLIFSLTKFSLISVQLPTYYFVIEFMSYICILILVVFLDKIYYNKLEKEKQLKEEIESIKRVAESRESQLLMRIMKLESKEREAILFTTHKKKTLHHLFTETNKNFNLEKNLNILINNLGKTFEIVSGIIYWIDTTTNLYNAYSTFAIDKSIKIPPFKAGEGLCGQSVSDCEIKKIDNIPTDYFIVASGLGDSQPLHLYFLPIVKNNSTLGLFELGTFKEIEIEKIWPDINEKVIDLV